MLLLGQNNKQHFTYKGKQVSGRLLVKQGERHNVYIHCGNLCTEKAMFSCNRSVIGYSSFVCISLI